MAEKRDYYEVLGLGKDAADADIKKAYRRLAKQYHPDMNPDDRTSEARFKEINEAYEVLSDTNKKSQYDRFGHAGMDPNSFSGFGDFDFGIGDIFESFFGGSGFGRSSAKTRNAPQKGADLKYSMEIAFEEAAFGVEKEISVQKLQDCTVCNGSGAKQGTSPSSCKHCGGSGQVQFKQSTPFGQFVNVKTCDVCRGEGRIITDPCTVCAGKGKVRKNVKISIKVPAGIDDEQVISLRGEGEAGTRGGPYGNLYVSIKIKPHMLFQRHGNDVICEIPITFAQGALGSEIDVPTLDGKIKYTVPEGTQSGTIFRIKSKGIPYIRGSGRGDQYIKVNIEVPKKLNEKQKAMLRQFAEIVGDDVHEQRKGFFDKMKEVLGI